MMPTIRVDDEVYAWLQGQARPFEDTPNSVLRGIAGLDESHAKAPSFGSQHETNPSEESVTVKRNRGRRTPYAYGRQLNAEWEVGAKHALFHRDGRWYNNLERFPGALFDPYGYVLFETEEEYMNCPHLKIGQETNVPEDISSIPGYVKKKR